MKKEAIFRFALTSGIKALTGLDIRMQGVTVGITKTLVGINDLQVFNPVGFREKIMADLPEVYIDYDLLALLRKKVHIEELRINLKELTIIKSQEGQLNLNSLTGAKESKDQKPAPKAKKKKKPQFSIDNLELKIAKVVYKDYSSAEPKIVELNLHINKRFENVGDFNQLRRIILGKALTNLSAVGLVVPGVDEVADTAKEAKDTVKDISKAAGNTLKKTTQVIKQIISTTAQPEKSSE